MSQDKIAAIQAVLGVEVDGRWGPKTQRALDAVIHPSFGPTHEVIASSFADPKDVHAFKKCKERGGSDEECFKYGDNGIGCWMDDVKEGTGQACALPPDDMIEKWGSIADAKHKLVEVQYKDTSIVCVLKDRMPWKRNIHNGAGIDLNPDSCRALGLEPPIMVEATWKWA